MALAADVGQLARGLGDIPQFKSRDPIRTFRFGWVLGRFWEAFGGRLEQKNLAFSCEGVFKIRLWARWMMIWFEDGVLSRFMAAWGSKKEV